MNRDARREMVKNGKKMVKSKSKISKTDSNINKKKIKLFLFCFVLLPTSPRFTNPCLTNPRFTNSCPRFTNPLHSILLQYAKNYSSSQLLITKKLMRGFVTLW